MNDETKYLDYDGLSLFKQKLDRQRTADNLATAEALNDLSGDI
jgi:hypothetical protein